jgi:hypothetical protein
LVGGRSYLFHSPRKANGLSGINSSFPELSRYQGWITHVLLTRSPLSPSPKAWFSLDLHVLSAPPAFVLSQDQTLREDVCRLCIPWNEFHRNTNRRSHLSLCSKSWHTAIDCCALDECCFPSTATASRSRGRVSTSRTLLSFQRPSRCERRKKSPDSRQRPQISGQALFRVCLRLSVVSFAGTCFTLSSRAAGA